MRVSYLLVFALFISSQAIAAISYVTSVTDRGNDDKADLTVPVATQSGDVLLTQVTFRNISGSDGISAPVGWILVAPQDRSSDVFQALYYKVATVTDAGSNYEWDFDGNGSRRYILAMSVFSGVDNVTPIADEDSATDGSFFGSLTAPSVTTANANSMLVGFYTLEAGNQSFSAGVGMTEAYDVEEHNNGNGITSMSSWEVFPAISATGSRVATASKDFDDGVGHLIALNEGASSPTVDSVTTDCSSISSLVIQFSKDLDSVSAQNISNYSLVNAASNSIAILAATLTLDSVTLTLASDMKDLTPYTLTVNNVEDLDGNPIAINSTANFTLSCDLNCITDNFSGPGELSDSWSVGSSNGSFGNPRIVANGRLRLTDDSSEVSTVATLLNQFPGAENRIEIEFDYYGYDGNGADGIAVNFSDASIAPSAGAFGGSLGYAQKTGINGFAGGWLGVGIDEYGNFSTSGEGRDGGGGSRIEDSVSLRGSGSGTSGYPYLTGTTSLSPGIDQGGSTPNPGHRYKIAIDHTSGGGTATVIVQRDTGSGYVTIVPEFNIFALNPSQAAVPENWVVSFTGSTGGSTNIHEMGDLKVCAAQPIQTFSIVDHYDISHTTPGLTCESSEVTITAHDVDHAAINILVDTSISLTTTPAISGIVTSPVIMLAGNSSASIYLQQTTALANIDIDVTDGSFTDDEGSSEDPKISFLDTAFRFYADEIHTDTAPINYQISAKQNTISPNIQALTLKAVQKNTDTGACEAALLGSQSVGIAYTCKDPSACSARQLSFSTTNETDKIITGTNNGAALSYTAVDMEFDDGSAPFNFNFPDAGKIQLHANINVAEALPDPGFTLTGSSNEFVVRPFAFSLGFDPDYDAADASGTRFVSAGTAFPMTIKAVNWESADDTNNDGIPDAGSNVSDNLETINFGQELVGSDQALNIGASLKLPSSGLFGVLAAPEIETSAAKGFFTLGITSSAASLTWDEVGIIDIDVALDNYLMATGANISGEQNNVGRFYPHQFSITASDISNSCGVFTYMDQPFSLGYTLEAQNKLGAKTQYYDGAFVKMTPLADIDFVAENNNDAGSYEARLMGFGNSSWSSGEYLLATQGTFSRATLGLVDGAYQTLQIGLQVNDVDSDGDGNVAKLIALDMKADENTDCIGLDNCNAKLIGELDIRFGQLKLGNTFGPETADLDMEVSTEYYNGTNFVTNIDDACTVLSVTEPRLSPIALSWTDNLGVGETAPNPIPVMINLAAGVGVINFTAAGIGNDGSVDYQYDTNNFLPWLNTENDNDGDYADNSKGKVTFGQFRGNDRMIYWREIVR